MAEWTVVENEQGYLSSVGCRSWRLVTPDGSTWLTDDGWLRLKETADLLNEREALVPLGVAVCGYFYRHKYYDVDILAAWKAVPTTLQMALHEKLEKEPDDA